MASTKVRGITIELSADASGVVNSLKDVNSSIKSTQSELRDIDRLLKLDPSNVELLAQKHEALQRQIENTENKITLLREAEEDLKAQMVDGGTEEQQKQLAALQREIIGTEQSLRKYSDQMDDAEDETLELAKAEEKAQGSTEKLSEGFTVVKGVLSNLITQGIQAAANGIKNFAGEMVDVAAEMKALDAKFSQTFGELEGQAQSMIDKVGADTGILASRLKSTAANIYAFARSSGASTSEAMQLTETALYAAADGAAYYDKSLEETAETVQSFLKGNFANDAALGVSATEFTRNAKAMELFGAKYNELSEIQKQQTLLQMVTDAQKVSGAMGQAAREADGWENVQGNLNETWRQFQAAVGTPVLENLIPVIKRLQDKLLELTRKINWDKFGQMVAKAFDGLLTALDWILDNGDAVISVIAGIGAAMAAIKISQFLGIGGMITGIAAALIGGATALISWGKAQEEARIAADPLIAATRELAGEIEANQADVDALTESYNAMNEAREQSLASIEAEAELSESLFEQLDGLVDANGKIAEGEEARAQVLLDQLNGALGTEYEITDGMITNYNELEQSVYDLIEAKKQEAMTAVWTRQLEEAQQGLIDSQRELEDLSLKQAEANDNLTAAQEAYADAIARAKEQDPSGIYVNQIPYVKDAKRAVDEATQAVADADAQYKTTEQAARGFAYNSQQALDNMTAIIEGDFDAIETTSYETFEAMGGDTSAYAQTVNENVNIATGHWQEALANQLGAALDAQVDFKDAGEGTVDAYVNGQKVAEHLTKEEAQALVQIGIEGLKSGEWEKSGKNAAEGFADGLSNTYWIVEIKRRARELAGAAVTSANARLQEKSPSRVFMKIGEYVGEGFAIGIEDSTSMVEKASKDMADTAINAMRGVKAPSITGANTMTSYASRASAQNRDITAVVGLLKEYLPELANRDVVMDSGELVGSLAPKFSTKFGAMDTLTARGTI